MAARVRIEYVRLASLGRPNTSDSDVITSPAANGQVLDVLGASVQSSAAPAFSQSGPFAGGVYARITCVSGAVVATAPAANPIATETSGIRIQVAGPPVLFEIVTGQKMAFIESADAPAGVGGGGGGGTGDASEATLQDILTELQTQVTALAPIVQEGAGGTNGYTVVKVNQPGAGTYPVVALDSDEKWDLIGWRLSFTAATTVTFSMDDDDANLQYVLDIPSAGIDSEAPNPSVAWLTGNVGEPLGITITAGNMKGWVIVRKHT